MRKGCRTSKYEKACPHYNYGLGRCTYGMVKATCAKIEKPKVGTKAARQVAQVREFYAGF